MWDWTGRRQAVLSMLGIFALATVLFGCLDPTPVPPTSPPTLTLFPPTALPTPVPATPTPLPPTLARLPNQIPTDTPEARLFLPESVSLSTQAAIRDLQSALNLSSSERVTIYNIQQTYWRDARLECGEGEISQAIPTARGISGYRLVLGVNEALFIYHTDEVGGVRRCTEENWQVYRGTPLVFDPTAVWLVEQSQRDLQRRLAVEAGQIELLDFTVMTWLESSLGCPRSDGNYTVETLPGFRILWRVTPLSGESEEHAYHSDGWQIFYCPLEREVLPPPFNLIPLAAEETIIPTPPSP